MSNNARFWLLVLSVALLIVCAQCGFAQQSISQTGLLPIYGVDVPDAGTSAEFQKLWDALKGCGFNSVRFSVDVSKPETAANEIAQLCAWAKASNVYLLPVLKEGEAGKALPDTYAQHSAETVQNLAKLLLTGENKQNYTQILAFQLESDPSKTALDAASQLRKAETEALKDSGLDVTPVQMSMSFDQQLIAAQAEPGEALSDEMYGAAYASLKTLLAPLAASADVDLICVEWFPGSAERIAGLLDALKSDFPDKQTIFTTGCSTKSSPAEAQKQYLTAAFANAADYRTREGSAGTFLGIFLHKALGGDSMSPPNSAEDNMGLFARKDEGGAVSFAPLPGAEALLQIAGAVTDANTAASAEPASTDANATDTEATSSSATSSDSGSSGESFAASLGNTVKDRVKEGLAGLLDKVFQKLGDKIDSVGSDSGSSSGYSSGYSDPYQSGGSSSSTPLSVTLTKVDLAPASPKVGDQITCQATLQNAGGSAWGLSAAVVDGQGYALDNNAQQSGISLDANGTKNVTLSWPASAGKTSASVEVYDSTFNKLASAPVDIDVSGSGGGSSQSLPGVVCSSQDVSFSPAKPLANAPVKVTVSMLNSDTKASPGLDVLLIDADASPAGALLAEADGNVVPANNTKSASLDWTPLEQKPYNLAIQVWLGYDTLVSETKLPPVVVGASSGGSGGGIQLPGKLQGMKVGLSKVMSGKVQTQIPMGLPLPEGFSIGTDPMTPMSGKLSVSFSLANPFIRPLQDLSAALLVDGKQVETKSLGTLLPQQKRSVVFTPDALQGGKHTLQVSLIGGGAKKLHGTLKSDITISSRMLSTMGAVGRMEVGPGASTALKGQSKTRDLLPPTFSIGGKTVAARPSAPLIAPIAPQPGKLTPVKTRPLVRATTPKVSTSDSTTTKPTIPGIAQRDAPVVKPTIPGVNAPGTTVKTGTLQTPGKLTTVGPPETRETTASRPATPGKIALPGNAQLVKPAPKPDLVIAKSDISYFVNRGTLQCVVNVRNATSVAVTRAKVNCSVTFDSGSPIRKDFTVDVAANGTTAVKWSCPMTKASQIKIDAAAVCPNDATPANNQASRTWSVRG